MLNWSRGLGHWQCPGNRVRELCCMSYPLSPLLSSHFILLYKAKFKKSSDNRFLQHHESSCYSDIPNFPFWVSLFSWDKRVLKKKLLIYVLILLNGLLFSSIGRLIYHPLFCSAKAEVHEETLSNTHAHMSKKGKRVKPQTSSKYSYTKLSVIKINCQQPIWPSQLSYSFLNGKR